MRINCEDCKKNGQAGNDVRRYRVGKQEKTVWLCWLCFQKRRYTHKIHDVEDEK